LVHLLLLLLLLQHLLLLILRLPCTRIPRVPGVFAQLVIRSLLVLNELAIDDSRGGCLYPHHVRTAPSLAIDSPILIQEGALYSAPLSPLS